jgi:uncharacterized membrane protein
MSPEKSHSTYQFFKNIERLLNLTDCIFAFAITLMVLSLAVPVMAKNDAATELSMRLFSEWPSFLIYVISFIIISEWWMTHHHIFQHITKINRTIVLLNFVFLFFITLIPFHTALLIQYPETPVAVIFYATTQAFAGLILALLWWYSTKDRRFSDADLTPGIVHYRSDRLVIGSIGFFISGGIALFNTYIAVLSLVFIGFLLWYVSRWLYLKRLVVPDQAE